MAKTLIGNVRGKDGRGISSIKKTASDGTIDTYTITYTDGTTSTFNVTNSDEIALQRQIVSASNIETSAKASHTYTVGSYAVVAGVLKQVTSVIAEGETFNSSNSKSVTVMDSGSAIDSIYPVGSIYMNVNSVNPSTLFGGTWKQIAQGRTLIGAGTGTDANSNSQSFTLGGTGGEYISKHLRIGDNGHSVYKGGSDYSDRYLIRDSAVSGTSERNAQIPLLQPYLVVNIWQRTA